MVVTKPGHDPITNAIEIKAGKVEELDVTLTANTAPASGGGETVGVTGSADTAAARSSRDAAAVDRFLDVWLTVVHEAIRTGNAPLYAASG